jgi:ABC-type Zn uptake system ZnuABC Zn-binding protein ZnuA
MRHSLIIVALALVASAPAPAQLRVVTSTTDLADIAAQVGGAKAKVTHISEGYQDPHFAEAKPSFVLQLRNADVFAFVGLDLEIGWMSLLIQGARNPKIAPGGAGYLDVSRAIDVLDRARTPVDRSMGDVHALGNPHYWLDPENGRRIAKAIAAKLSQKDAANAAYYAQRAADFDRRLDEALKRWKAQFAPYKGIKVVTYHRSWSNFVDAFGLEVIGYVEPKPGIPPTPQHTLDVIQAMKAQNVKIIIVEPYFDSKTPNSIASQTGGKVVVLPPSVGGVKEASDYLKLFETDINLLVAAIKSTGAR